MNKFAMMQSIHSGIQKSAGIEDVVKQITDWYNKSPQNRELTHGLLGGLGGAGLGSLFGGRRGAVLGGLLGGGLGWGGTRAYNAGYMPGLRNYLQQFTQKKPAAIEAARRKAPNEAAVANALKAPGSTVPAMIQKGRKDLELQSPAAPVGTKTDARFYNTTPEAARRKAQNEEAVANALKAPGSTVQEMIRKAQKDRAFKSMVGRGALDYSKRVMAPIHRALRQKDLQNQARVGSLYADMKKAISAGDTDTARARLSQINQLTENGWIGNPVTQGDRALLKAPLSNQVRHMNRDAQIADKKRISSILKHVTTAPVRLAKENWDTVSNYAPAIGEGLIEGAGQGASKMHKILQDSASRVATPIVENF